MTLCMAWRSVDDNIHFASDSRVTVNDHHIDSCIKVLRIPYRIVSVADDNSHPPPEVAKGDIAMAASGASMIAMMTKEALVEILRTVQGVPGHNTFGMDEISDLLFRGFQEMCRSFAGAMRNRSDTTVVFAGFCKDKRLLRAFKMEHLGSVNEQIINEVLQNPGDIEIYGSGTTHGQNAMAAKVFSSRSALEALKEVIDDLSEPSVGGNIQYGSFAHGLFVIKGVAAMADGKVHYWRGPLDLNSQAFTPGRGLLPLFPYIDMISSTE